jgi:hypothetical protein
MRNVHLLEYSVEAFGALLSILVVPDTTIYYVCVFRFIGVEKAEILEWFSW